MTALLFLSPRVPWPLDTGAKIRTRALLTALLTRFDVDYAGFLQPGLDPAQARRSLTGCRGVTLFPEPACAPLTKAWLALRTLPGRRPVTVAKYQHRGLADYVRAWTAAHPAGIVHADHLHLAPYLGLGPAALRVIDEHNVESRILERLASRHGPLSPVGGYLRLQARRMRECERALVSQADRVLAVSEADAAELAAMARVTHIRVIPNGVDLEYFAPEPEGLAPEDGRLVFVGSMNWLPNQDGVRYFVHEILPLLRGRTAQGEGVPWRLDIVGQSPPPAIRALAGDGVRVTGTVEDVRPYMRSAAIYVVPLRIGGGSRLKILEAFAMGVPVVSTAVGCEGLGAQDGRHLLVADTPRDFAQALTRLRAEPGLGSALAREGRRLVKAHFGWRAIGEKLVAQYEPRPGMPPGGPAAVPSTPAKGDAVLEDH